MNDKKLQPLCVDLDGTLVLTDTLHESLILLLKNNLLYIFLLPWWFLKGKAFFKDQIARRVKLTPELLPYNKNVLDYIKEKNQQGSKLYLVTASHQSVADGVADHLGIFTGQFGSNENANYKGNKKAAFLNDKFGQRQYDYIGNDAADLPVWAASANAIVACASQSLVRKAAAINKNVTQIKNETGTKLFSYLKMMRMHQWVKNLLIFLPLLLSHTVTDIDKFFQVCYGFILFSFAASGIYIFNDLIDLNNDRAHPKKSKRPLATGEVPVSHGFIAGTLLWSISLIVSFIYFDLLFLLIVGYIVLNFLYSTTLKKLVLIDVVVLAGFYTIRIIIGSVMAVADISFWLLTFSLFVFFSLALVKRYSEIAFHTEDNTGVRGRGYHSEDELITTILGVASGLMSILVMALYIHDPHTQQLYSNSNWLWLTIPVLLYWMSRLWLLAHRRQITDDPILFALKDVESYATAVLLMFGFYMAI